MNLLIDNALFKKIIILFWTIWWLIALWTDAVGGLAHIGVLNRSWAPDTNYPFLVDSLKMYHVPIWLPGVLFIGILLWSALSALLFLWATMGLMKNSEIYSIINFMVRILYCRSNCNEV